MVIEASAYAVLGVGPGADNAAIDEAYRRLIKLHHPDRSGGDAARAAEINRAYFELRRKPPPSAPGLAPANGDIAAAIYARRAARRRVDVAVRRRRRIWPLMVLAAGVLLVLERERATELALDLQDGITGGWRPATGGPAAGEVAPASGSIEDGLAQRTIGRAIERARALAATGSAEEIAAESRACHRAMRSRPEVAQLDRCAAFDYAVTLIQDRDPVEDEGPFSASAVTARQMAAASLLTSDYMAIEGRLDAIRGRVELALAPPSSEPPTGPGPS